tara:strand:+ start:220 stop:876 length:657 start_codon:yes stop_codon:yes gene_type:complete
MNIFNWHKYNSNFLLLKKIVKFNKKNKFNFIESGIYNHIRDLFCLSLILAYFKKRKKKISILDFGSNLIPYSNLINKINLKNYKISIYDPFSKKRYLKKKNIEIFKEEKLLKKKWDMVNFGSSIQYLQNLNSLNKINFHSTLAILITHTPISLSRKYISKQINSKNLNQNIHSLNEVMQFFKKKKFKLEFKSRNENKYISAKTKYKTFSMNLLFLKNE